MTAPTLLSRRRRGVPAVVVSLAAAVVAGVLVWNLLPSRDAGGGRAVTFDFPTTGPATRPSAGPSATALEPDPEQSRQADLLTPDGVRTVIAALKPVMGGTKVLRLTVHPGHASAEAPVKGRRGAYDRFSYRDGRAVKDGPGGSSPSTPIDLDAFDWDKLPGLMRRADRELGIDKPTSRHIIVDNVFHGGREGSVRVYVGDEYGSGYLAADTKGKVLAKHPAQ